MGDRAVPHEDPAYYEALGRAIKLERVARGMERRDLATASGVSYPYLSEIESGSKRPSSRALLAIAEALGVALSALLGSAESLAQESPTVADRRSHSRRPSRAVSAPMMAAPPPADDEMRSTRARAHTTSNRQLAEIVRVLERLSPEDLETIAALVRRLAFR